MAEQCRVIELRCREVINLCDGSRLGYVGDVVIDVVCGRVLAIVVPGKCRLFGLLGREEDDVIPWESIEKIGGDIILVRYDRPIRRREAPKRWFFKT